MMDYYNLSDVYRKCSGCGEEHSVFYKEIKEGRLVLGMACKKSKPKTRWIKFEEGLKIPVLGTKNRIEEMKHVVEQSEKEAREIEKFIGNIT